METVKQLYSGHGGMRPVLAGGNKIFYLDIIMNLDFETYSQAGTYFDLETLKWRTANRETGGVKRGLPLIGAYVYAEHPSTEVLVACTPGHKWHPGEPEPPICDHVRRGGLVTAWHSFFEWCIWNLCCVPKYGWPPLPIEQMRDTMAAGLAWSLPGSLDKASAIVHGVSEKDKVGYNIMMKLSQPRGATKKDPRLRFRRTDGTETEQWEHLDDYCAQDVVAEMSIAKMIPELSPGELEVWKLDQKINARGVMIDLPLVEACLKIMAESRVRYGLKLAQLTGGAITAVSQATAILNWVNDPKLKTLDVEHPDGLQNYLDTYSNKLPPNVVEVLEIRRDVGGSAPAKLVAMKYQAARDGRVHGMYQFCGAQRTRRFAGRGVQTQNMPAGGLKLDRCPKCGRLSPSDGYGCLHCMEIKTDVTVFDPCEWGIEAVEAVIPSLYSGDFDTVARQWENPAKAVSGCLRSMLVPAPGYEYISSDYSAIEAVVLAAMAGEQWVIDVFRSDGKLYERTGSKITGVPVEEILAHKEETGSHHPSRKIGKVATLASGFQGARGAWLKFKAGEFLTNKEIDEGVKAWRAASPSIVEYWYRTEDAAIAAVENPGGMYPVMQSGVTYQKLGRALYCYLPNGEWLTYLDAAIKPRKKLSAVGWRILELCDEIVEGRDVLERDELRHLTSQYPDIYSLILNSDFVVTSKVRDRVTAHFFEWRNTLTYWGVQNHNWVENETYGGKLVENNTQATARFILTSAMPNLEAAGYPIVMHTHDEIVSEIPEGTGSIEEYERIMSIMPPWAVLPDGTPWPIRAAGGWRGWRFRK